MGCCGKSNAARPSRMVAPAAPPSNPAPPTVETPKDTSAEPTNKDQNPQTVGNQASWVIKGV